MLNNIFTTEFDSDWKRQLVEHEVKAKNNFERVREYR
jgi:hypothetical protein